MLNDWVFLLITKRQGKHIWTKCRKIYLLTKVLMHFVPLDVAKTISDSVRLPYFEYCCPVCEVCESMR